MSEFKVEFKDIENGRLHYKVFINNHWFDYFTGFGHVYHTKKSTEYFRKEHSLADDDVIINVTNTLLSSKFLTIVKRKDVEHCLYLDAKCGEMSFYDFCDELGYNQDSIKDFETYRACMETSHKMRGYKYFEGVEEY